MRLVRALCAQVSLRSAAHGLTAIDDSVQRRRIHALRRHVLLATLFEQVEVSDNHFTPIESRVVLRFNLRVQARDVVDSLPEHVVDGFFAKVVCQDAALGAQAIQLARQDVEVLLLGVLAVFLKHVVGREALRLELLEGVQDLFLFRNQALDPFFERQMVGFELLVFQSQLDALLLQRAVVARCDLNVALRVHIHIAYASLAAEASRISGVFEPLASFNRGVVFGHG